MSGLTGHRIKIWNRDFAFQGEIDQRPCPENNWAAMPVIEEKTRAAAQRNKFKMFNMWDQNCGCNYINLTGNKTITTAGKHLMLLRQAAGTSKHDVLGISMSVIQTCAFMQEQINRHVNTQLQREAPAARIRTGG